MAENLILVAKKNTKSPVWTHFGFIPDDNGDLKDLDSPTCICRICQQEVSAHDENMSNLLSSHLKTYHLRYNNLPVTSAQQHRAPPSQHTIEESFERVRKYSKVQVEELFLGEHS